MTSIFVRKLNGLLKTESIGKVIHFLNETGSTNTVLYGLAESGASEGTTVIADKQTSGRGRLDRTWISPPGVNLYVSVLFRPQIPAFEAPLLTFVASVALTETIRKSGAADTFIKWPNDVEIAGKKAAGILTEMKPGGDRAEFVVVGIGVNINMSSEDMKRELGAVSRTATSLKEQLGREIDRAKFTADLLSELETRYRTFNRRGKPSILSDWTERWGGKNQKVRVSLQDRSVVEGTAEGIDGDGHLLVRKSDDELIRVVAGDVSAI